MKVYEDLKRNFYKEGTNKPHIGKIVSSIIIVIALLLFIIYKNRDLKAKAHDRNKNTRFTIGTIKEKNQNFRSSKPTVKYYYQVLNNKYENTEHIDASYESEFISNGDRYYVQYSNKNPSNSKLLLDYPVPDTINFVPDTGWKYIPGYNAKDFHP